MKGCLKYARWTSLLLAIAANTSAGLAQEQVRRPPRNPPGSETSRETKASQAKRDAPTSGSGAATRQPDQPGDSDDQKLIRTSGKSFENAYNEGDLNLISAFFTEDAEYVDVEGNVYEGRKEIEKVFQDCFEELPGSKMQLNVERIRLIGPGVAIEDGQTVIMPAEGDEGIQTRYSAVHVKHGDQWLVASVRERSLSKAESHRVQLEQLKWLQGNWVDESDEAVVIFSCDPVDEGNFLLRKFSIQIAGEPAMTGEQRIGWDPVHRKLRTWIFDSQGGYGEGFWFRDDNRWILKCVGVTSSGQTASSTTVYQPLDENRMTWQSIDHEVGGMLLPDSDPITIVRRSPIPENDTGEVAKSGKRPQ